MLFGCEGRVDPAIGTGTGSTGGGGTGSGGQTGALVCADSDPKQVVAPQRVTAPAGHDEDVAGWADDVLVRFGIRAGRLCVWSQRAATRDHAAAHLAATPETWRAFAQRNAELAAGLARGPHA